PIFIPNNSVIINRNTYHVPDSLKINFVPMDFNLENSFVKATVKYTKVDNTVTVESAYHLKRATVPAVGFEDVKKFREELEQKNQLYIVLKRRSNVSSDTQHWINNK